MRYNALIAFLNDGMGNMKLQKEIVLDLLREGPMSTVDFRSRGIMSPASRVRDLRNDGHRIDTSFTRNESAAGFRNHNVARYILISEAQQ